MKFTISSKGVKRELTTPFALCIGPDDLDSLIRALQEARAGMLNSTYGWVRVDPSHPCDAPPNTEPLKWDEGLPHKPSHIAPKPAPFVAKEATYDRHYDSQGYCDNPARGY